MHARKADGAEAGDALGPTKSLSVTSVLVALVRTAAFEFLRPTTRKSMRSRTASPPARPKSRRAWSTKTYDSASVLGAFCFDMGSYAACACASRGCQPHSKATSTATRRRTLRQDKAQA